LIYCPKFILKKSQNVPSCTLIAAHMEGVWGSIDWMMNYYQLIIVVGCFIVEVIQIVNPASST